METTIGQCDARDPSCDPNSGSQLDFSIAPFVGLVIDSQQCQVITEVRTALINHLVTLQEWERRDVLRFLALKNLFTPPILDEPTLSAIAGHIIEIGKWRWL